MRTLHGLVINTFSTCGGMQVARLRAEYYTGSFVDLGIPNAAFEPDFCSVAQIQGLLTAKASSKAAISPPDRTLASLRQPIEETCEAGLGNPESFTPSFGKDSPPSSPADELGSRDVEKAVLGPGPSPPALRSLSPKPLIRFEELLKRLEKLVDRWEEQLNG
ncbi:hypothetical protein PG991_009167 [Apiospora marii]|uniref:Uncharacterized protein n=1 Tax=Apiospora marii TaxID=335849 RepID=A0ABR1RJX8_9PEZI